MDKEKVKLIVRNLESLINCLKEEINLEDTYSYQQYEEIKNHISDYDEVFYEDDDE